MQAQSKLIFIKTVFNCLSGGIIWSIGIGIENISLTYIDRFNLTLGVCDRLRVLLGFARFLLAAFASSRPFTPNKHAAFVKRL